MRVAAVMLLIVLLGACTGKDRQPPARVAGFPAAAAAVDSVPTLVELRNMTYRGIDLAPGPVTLVDGRWEGEPFAGGAARPRVQFVRDFHLDGDLDGDGCDEVVVLLGATGGGSGEILHLAVVARRESRWQNVATKPIGDRVQVRAARIAGANIVLDVVQAGTNDALCCPGDLVKRTWMLRPAGLEEAPAVIGGRLGLEVLMGVEWVLDSWVWDEPVTPGTEVTLVLQGSRITGTSGCNRYTATANAGTVPGDLRVGPVAGTRRACAEPAMAVESRFQSQLEGVTKFGFIAGQLAFTFQKDGVLGTMLFTGRAPRQE